MKVFVTRNIPESGLAKISAAGHEVVIGSDGGTLPKALLITRLREADPDAVLCLLTDQIDEEILAAAPRARIFANYAVGFDNIDLEAAAKRGIAVTNTPDVLTEAVAEHTVALMLSLARRVTEADRFTRGNEYQGWDPMLFLGMELKGKMLGIVGGGRIGAQVAEIASRGFGMSIGYHDQRRNAALEAELSAVFYPELDRMLPEADVISVHLPLTDSTRHSFNADTFAKMKSGSLLINTARGPIIDEEALARALKGGALVGAALDVFENEPSVHPDLLPLQNVILTPHIASATREAREAMSVIAADNIIAVLDGREPINPVS